MGKTFAYAFASGHIEFGPRVPNGALPICILDTEQRTKAGRLIHQAVSRKTIEAKARLAYDGETLLVPGVPKAKNQTIGVKAFMRWSDWVCGRPVEAR